MNYDEARQLKEGGWHWTTMNDGVVRIAQPCLKFNKEITAENFMEPLEPGDIEYCTPHLTKEGAEEHFYNYCLQQLQEMQFTSAQRCEVAGCGVWTDKALESPGLAGYFGAVFLCDVHRTVDEVARLHPFQSGIRVVHS